MNVGKRERKRGTVEKWKQGKANRREKIGTARGMMKMEGTGSVTRAVITGKQ